MFGHSILSQCNAQAMIAIKFALSGTFDLKGRPGSREEEINWTVLMTSGRERDQHHSSWLADNQSRDLNNELWLVAGIYLVLFGS